MPAKVKPSRKAKKRRIEFPLYGEGEFACKWAWVYVHRINKKWRLILEEV